MGIVGHSDRIVHELYTHSSAGALQQAVGTLPTVFKDTPPALPEPLSAEVSGAQLARGLAGKLTSKTWRALRDEFFALANEV